MSFERLVSEHTAGDVRIACPDPMVLAEAGRLSIASVVRFGELEAELPDIRSYYQSDAMGRTGESEGLVPDPRTIRPFTREELEYYTKEGSQDAIFADWRNVVFIPASHEPQVWGFLRKQPDPNNKSAQQPANCTISPPNMLTTTPDIDSRVEEALHIDKGELHKYRITVNYGPANRGFWLGTHSPVLLSELYDTRVTTASELRDIDPRKIGRVIRVLMRPGDLYLACTGKLVHDGTTLLSNGPEAAMQEALDGFARHKGYQTGGANQIWLSWYLQNNDVADLSTAAFHRLVV